MRRLNFGVPALAVVLASRLLAQTTPPAKQSEIKASILGSERGLRWGEPLPHSADEFVAGMTVPPSIDLIVLPQDAITEVPITSSYRFVLMRDGIAVVDPATRTVLQVIK